MMISLPTFDNINSDTQNREQAYKYPFRFLAPKMPNCIFCKQCSRKDNNGGNTFPSVECGYDN